MAKVLSALNTLGTVVGISIAVGLPLAALVGVLVLLKNIHEAHEYNKAEAAAIIEANR